MKIQISSKTRKQYLSELASLFCGSDYKQVEFFANVIDLYWEKGYFIRSQVSFLKCYPWANNRQTIFKAFRRMLHYQILIKDPSESYFYRINPAILISSGSYTMNIEFTIADTFEPEFMIPALTTSVEPIPEPIPEPEPVIDNTPQKINPRYKDLFKD